MKKLTLSLALFFFCTPLILSSSAAPDPEALRLLRQFVAEELNGNLQALADYDLATLEGHPLYGAPGRTFDTDDCNLARAIYALLYTDAMPGLSLATLGTGRPYRGDTMNSFHTLLGRPIADQPGRFAGLERHQPSDDLQRAARHIASKTDVKQAYELGKMAVELAVKGYN